MFYFVEDLKDLKGIKQDIDNQQENSCHLFNAMQDLEDDLACSYDKIYVTPAGYNSYLSKPISTIWDSSSIADVLIGYVIEV